MSNESLVIYSMNKVGRINKQKNPEHLKVGVFSILILSVTSVFANSCQTVK